MDQKDIIKLRFSASKPSYQVSENFPERKWREYKYSAADDY